MRVKVDPFMSAILRGAELDRAEEKRKAKVAARVFRPSQEWMEKVVSAYPKTATGETLDERATTLLSKHFMTCVLFATYGELKVSGYFWAEFPLTARRLTEIYAAKEGGGA